MQKSSKISRREFSAGSVMAMLAGVVVTVQGCGSGEGDPTSPSSGGDVTGVVSANHGHIAVVRSAQLMAGNAVMLDIRGNATHNHVVELSGDELRAIAAGQRVVKRSSNENSHFHEVTFN